MFAPAIPIVLVFGPSPIVGTNGEPEIRVEMMGLPDMPAIAFTIADDFCGCGGWYYIKVSANIAPKIVARTPFILASKVVV